MFYELSSWNILFKFNEKIFSLIFKAELKMNFFHDVYISFKVYSVITIYKKKQLTHPFIILDKLSYSSMRKCYYYCHNIIVLKTNTRFNVCCFLFYSPQNCLISLRFKHPNKIYQPFATE